LTLDRLAKFLETYPTCARHGKEEIIQKSTPPTMNSGGT
jgi:hypothetical protein